MKNNNHKKQKSIGKWFLLNKAVVRIVIMKECTYNKGGIGWNEIFVVWKTFSFILTMLFPSSLHRTSSYIYLFKNNIRWIQWMNEWMSKHFVLINIEISTKIKIRRNEKIKNKK